MEDEAPESPRTTSPARPTTTPEPPAQGKKQLSEAQKASLAKAREKARQTKLAKSEAKREEEKKFNEWQQQQEQEQQKKEELPDYKTQSDSDMSEPSPPPRKKKVAKKVKPVKRTRYESSDSSSDDEPPKQSAEDHMRTVKAAYDANVARYKNDIIYKNMFPFL